MLRDRVDEIIRKYRIDAVYAKDGVFMNWDEVCQDFACNFAEIIGRKNFNEDMRIAVYPGGNLGRKIVNLLLEYSYHSVCMIDNYAETKVHIGIPVITYSEWWSNNCTDAVLICSQEDSDIFINQLMMDGYKGEIVDVYKCLKGTYCNLELIPNDTYVLAGMWNYMYINRLELKYASAKEEEKEEILKILIYGLFEVRDFYYAERYIEEIKTREDYLKYQKALGKIQDEISQVVENKEIDNVWFMHVIDALESSLIEQIPVLKKIADNGIRVKGVTVQYPYTHWTFNTMFTGKNAFDIELGTMEIDWNDSELLRYLKEKHMRVSCASGNGSVINGVMKSVNHNDRKTSDMICYQLFEGFCLLEHTPKNNLIVLHSHGVHYPYYSVGSGRKLVPIPNEKISREEMYDQFYSCLSYINKQIEWYFPYYEKTGCPNLFMGDHGGSPDAVISLYFGIKKDFSSLNIETLTPALLISGLDKGKVVDGLIPNTSLPDMFLDMIKLKAGPFGLNLEKYVREYTYLQPVPAYDKHVVKQLLPRDMYGQYEGYIGVMTNEEIYLLSVTGRELYFRPKEYRYRNLASVDEWQDSKKKCKDLLQGREFPIEIYGLEKYKYHLEMLEKYDKDGFRKIMDKLSEVLKEGRQKS